MNAIADYFDIIADAEIHDRLRRIAQGILQRGSTPTGPRGGGSILGPREMYCQSLKPAESATRRNTPPLASSIRPLVAPPLAKPSSPPRPTPPPRLPSLRDPRDHPSSTYIGQHWVDPFLLQRLGDTRDTGVVIPPLIVWPWNSHRGSDYQDGVQHEPTFYDYGLC